MNVGLDELGIDVSLNFFCPKCRSNNIVIDMEEKYYKFHRCDDCGFVKK